MLVFPPGKCILAAALAFCTAVGRGSAAAGSAPLLGVLYTSYSFSFAFVLPGIPHRGSEVGLLHVISAVVSKELVLKCGC